MAKKEEWTVWEGTTPPPTLYDCGPSEDAEAAAWVRKHGGLDAVRSEWGSRVPYDKHEQRRQRLLGHIAECEAALGRRNARIEELGHRVGDLTAENAELRKKVMHEGCDEEFLRLHLSNLWNFMFDVMDRLGVDKDDSDAPDIVFDILDRRLMPEGMEWPRFEDGEQVRFGDIFLDHQGNMRSVYTIKMWQRHGFEIGTEQRTYDWHSDGECVRRPEPKVLDAYGEEVEVGDDLYSVEGMLKFHVSAIDRVNGRIATEAMFALDKWADPKMYTHRAPVLAADGKPLREEEHVWHVETGTELVVKDLPRPGEYQAVVVLYLPAGHLMSFDPNLLTHERPDTWERIEDDVMVDAKDYCESRGIRPEYPKHNGKAKCEDIVRRCREVARRERGE